MMNPRILSSRARFRGGAFRGARGGKASWEIALLVVVGVLGLLGLSIMLYRMARAQIKDRRTILRYSAYVLIVTLSLIIPAIVLLSLNSAPAVATVAIVTLCILLLPLLLWILIALRKARHFARSDDETANPEYVYTAKGKHVGEGPFPAYNFVPQAGTATDSTPVSVAPPEQQSKPSASV